jgi:hypothetical protein
MRAAFLAGLVFSLTSAVLGAKYLTAQEADSGLDLRATIRIAGCRRVSFRDLSNMEDQ